MPNMMMLSAMVVLILVIVGIFLFLIAFRMKSKIERPADYRAFFVLGIVFLPLGIVWTIMSLVLTGYPLIGFPFLAMGAIYLMIGLVNRDKWVRQEVSPSALWTTVLAITIGILVLFALISILVLGIYR